MVRFGLIVLISLLVYSASAARHTHPSRKHKEPWFCHDNDCPRFKTIKEKGPFALRRYEESTWAAVCVRDAQREDAIMEASAILMRYIGGENEKEKKLWGGVPFAQSTFLSLGDLAAWEDMAVNGTAVECVHKTVCVGYYLPEKYQGDKKAPKPESDRVRIMKLPKWTAHVLQFDGFPSRMRFVYHYIKLVNVLGFFRIPFNWRVATAFVYDPPFVLKHRHNEVVVPARRRHDGEGDVVVNTEGDDLGQEVYDLTPEEEAEVVQVFDDMADELLGVLMAPDVKTQALHAERPGGGMAASVMRMVGGLMGHRPGPRGGAGDAGVM